MRRVTLTIPAYQKWFEIVQGNSNNSKKGFVPICEPKIKFKRLIPPYLNVICALGNDKEECQRLQYLRIARDYDGVLFVLIFNDCSPVRWPGQKKRSIFFALSRLRRDCFFLRQGKKKKNAGTRSTLTKKKLLTTSKKKKNAGTRSTVTM